MLFLSFGRRQMSIHALYSHRGSSAAAPEGYSKTSLRMGAGAVLLLWSFSECFNNEQVSSQRYLPE